MTDDIPTIESSPLLKRIKEALDTAKPARGLLRVSVADDPRWEKNAAGNEIFVRWICWSIDDGDEEVIPPEFEVVHESVTRERLARELPTIFPDLEVLVDNDIKV
jgi:hypothetical protein